MDDGQQNGFFCFLHDPGSTSAAARRHRLWIFGMGGTAWNKRLLLFGRT